jgi:6-pyruvoyltetrahydropterin/6-carboxytetrahydropterin synthase
MRTCTRRLEFDAAHRVMRHESKCKHLHGHRYAIEVTCASAAGLDDLGRVIDFGVIKERLGAWIDDTLDHGTLLNEKDAALKAACTANGWRHFVMEGNPTAENIAEMLFHKAQILFVDAGVEPVRVRVYETPNCWADYP